MFRTNTPIGRVVTLSFSDKMLSEKVWKKPLGKKVTWFFQQEQPLCPGEKNMYSDKEIIMHKITYVGTYVEGKLL
jgi:hypothetical protein